MDCLEKLVECIERFNKGGIDADSYLELEKQILNDEIDSSGFLVFAIENFGD